VPRFPAVQRDLSLILDESVSWQQLSDAIEQVDQPLRTGIDYVTTYRGKQIEPGRKSVTVQLTYRWPEGTLRREQVDQQVEQVVEALAEGFSAQLRS
jgi:phenylalanyl-tRNA synthetase beta chain